MRAPAIRWKHTHRYVVHESDSVAVRTPVEYIRRWRRRRRSKGIDCTAKRLW